MREFISSNASPLFICLGKLLWPLILQVRHQVVGLSVVGDGLTRYKSLRGSRTVICPNHPTFADGDVMFLFSRLVDENFHYLAAREIFRSNHGLYRLILSLAGCHSVRRGTMDLASYKAIRQELVAGSNKIVMFPEGEISHQFEDLLPLEPGTAQISFWALEKLKKQGQTEPVYVLPLTLSYAYIEDPRYVFDFALDKLEETLGITTGGDYDQQRRLQGVVGQLINVLEVAYSCEVNSQSLDLRLTHLRKVILEKLAFFLGFGGSGDEVDVMHRLHGELERLQFVQPDKDAYTRRISEERRSMSTLLMRDWQRTMNLRFCLQKCSGSYANQEIDEALCLLEREVLGETLPRAKRVAVIAIGNALNLLPLLGLYETDRRLAVRRVNGEIASQMKAMQLDLANEVQRLENLNVDLRSWAAYHRSPS